MLFDRPFLDIPRYPQSIVQCLDCGLGMSVPLLTDAQLAELYDDGYSQNPYYKTENASKQYPFLDRWHHGVKKRAIRLAMGLPLMRRRMQGIARRSGLLQVPLRPDLLVLDYGAGDWRYVNLFRDLGYAVYGYDINPLTRTLPHFYDISSRSTVFDAVRLSHVVEHVTDPVALFRQINALLRPGGRLCFATPNFESPLTRVGRNGGWHHLPYHRHFFTRKSLEILAERSGFHTECVYSYSNGTGFLSHVVNKLLPYTPWAQIKFKIRSLIADRLGHGDCFAVTALKIRDADHTVLR